jgi:hypothetical protein
MKESSGIISTELMKSLDRQGFDPALRKRDNHVPGNEYNQAQQ